MNTRTPPVEAALIPVTTPSQPLCAVQKPNSITLATSELAPNMFGASSELASNMFRASSELVRSQLVRSWNLAYHLAC